LGTYRVERHEASGGARVDVYGWWGDDRVAVVDAWLVRPPDSAELLGRLPPVERTHRYEMVERELWSVTEVPDAVVEEMVWGSRGLSAVLVRTGSAESILRVRGFEPMDANQWIDGFLRFVAIPEE
jgi:hypothetical protein